MYCKNCGVHVDGIYDVCPLCKSPLEGEPAERPLYPEKHIRNRAPGDVFMRISSRRAFDKRNLHCRQPYRCKKVSLVRFCTNPHFIRLFYTQNHRFLQRAERRKGVFANADAVRHIHYGAVYFQNERVVLCLCDARNRHIVDCPAPCFFGAFRKRKGMSFFRYMWMTCLLGIVPAAAVMAGACTEIILPMVAFGISMITLIFLVAFTGRTIYNEIKKKTHI